MSRGLRAEIGKLKPFASREQEAFLNLSRTTDALLDDVVEVLKPAGLSATAYNVLRILRGAGKPLACGEIARQMITRDPDITRLLDRLEKRGLVARGREEKDRRIVRTRITAAGQKLLAKLDEPMIAAHRKQLGHLSRAKLEQLIALLEEARVRKKP
jgi:DNA-binding MarR family transcriptional regulator